MKIIRHFSGKYELLIVAAIAIFFIFGSVYVMNGAWLHPEMNVRLPHYLGSEKSLLQKIFEVNGTEGGNYRARDLSYLFDIFDALFIQYIFSIGHPGFVSFTYYLFIFLIAMLIYYFSRKILKNSFTITVLILLLYLTTANVFLSGIWFRTAKIGASFSILLLLILSYQFFKLISSGKMIKRKEHIYALLILIVSIISSLFDEQGFFVASVVLLDLIAISIYFNKKKLIIYFITSIMFYFLYKYYLSREITHMLLGYRPKITYQSFDYFSALNPHALWLGFITMFDVFRLFLGSIATNKFIILIAALFAALLPRFIKAKKNIDKKSLIKKLLILILSIINIALFILMSSLMFVRHYPAVDEGSKRLYYWLPMTTVFLFLLILICSKIISSAKKAHVIMIIILTMLVINNAIMLKIHRKFVYGPQPALLVDLRSRYNKNSGTYDLSGKIYNEAAIDFLMQKINSKNKN